MSKTIAEQWLAITPQDADRLGSAAKRTILASVCKVLSHGHGSIEVKVHNHQVAEVRPMMSIRLA